MGKTTKWILVVVLVLCAFGGWYAYRSALPEALVRPIVRGPIVRAVPANVVVLAEANRPIKSDYAGRITKAAVKLGSEVKAGDVLFELDTRDLDLEIQRTETDYVATKDRFALGSAFRFELAASEETERINQRLLTQGRVSQVDMDRMKRSVEQLRDKIEQEKITNRQTLANFENTLAQKRLQRDRMKVIAPLDGTITELDAATNDLVGGGQALARIISKERLVQAQISEENFAGVKPGLKANVQFLGYGYQQFSATVDRVLPSADERTRRYTAFLAVDIPPEQLMPDLTGEASIVVEQKENVIVAPVRAMMGHNLVLVKDGRAVLTHTMVGLSGGGLIEIVRGVAEGDLVIARDPAEFKDGQRVRVVMPPPAAK
jgi:RND family efflux transporter MFP subunit